MLFTKKSNIRGEFVLQEHDMGLREKFCDKMFVFYCNIRLSGRISGNLPARYPVSGQTLIENKHLFENLQ